MKEQLDDSAPAAAHPASPGIARRDALKAVAALAAAPFATAAPAQTGHPSAEPSLTTSQRDQLFDANWRFHRGDAPGAERPEFDDGQWRTLDVPHDWSIENLPPHPESTGEGAVWGETLVPSRVGPFDRYLSPGGRDTGWVVGGTGWYRKHFRATVPPAGHSLEILFEGIYMDSDVWLNGRHLGNHPYGYTTFGYDLTPHLLAGGDNVLAVRVRNEGRNSRWYSGSGITRHVWLTAGGEIRIPRWGVGVTTPEVSASSATVALEVRMENRGSAPREVTVHVRLLDAKGNMVAAHEESHAAAVAAGLVRQTLTLANPRLWSPAAPALYAAEVSLRAGGQLLDRSTTVFGIRRVEVDAARGLRINGEPVKLQGGCMHHDNGLLGAAAIDRADERRVELMKANGFNAIRCSHNPPSPAFLDACDRLGMLVVDETFDQWEVQKNPQDYHLYFKDWWQRDVESMVLRDRNHPSVIFWSIGNEIPERIEPRGIESARKLAAEVRRLDPTRAVTMAVPFFFEPGGKHPWSDSDAAFQHLDVCGYNYQWPEYETDHARRPERVIMGTESFPLHAFENWQMVEKHAYVLGDFVWTGMDYLGESGIGNAQLDSPSPFPMPTAPPAFTLPASIPGDIAAIFAKYPWFNAYCGDIDLIGGKKAQGYYRDILWGRSKLEMAVERPIPEGHKEVVSSWGWPDELRSWTWPGQEGRKLTVRLYSSGDQVRLLLNGQEIGVKTVSVETKRKAEFEVPYAPGELKAIALLDGKPVAELAFRTAGPPAAIRLKADRSAIHADRRDLSFVALEVVDRAGNLVPDAVLPVTFSISGAGELAGSGSANPKDVVSFRQPRTTTFHGCCLAIVRPTGPPGTITLSARAEGLAPAATVIGVSGRRA